MDRMTTEVGSKAPEDPRISKMVRSYVNYAMAPMGPYVSIVFFALLVGLADARKKRGYVRVVDRSVDDIARIAGISKRKTIDALKVLRENWIIVQRNGKGRGNKNSYYFMPVNKWWSP